MVSQCFIMKTATLFRGMIFFAIDLKIMIGATEIKIVNEKD